MAQYPPLPTTEASASPVLDFLAAAAPAAEELLLPVGSARGRSSENGDKGEELQEQCARKKTMAAEWDRLFTPLLLFISPLEIYVGS
jgi:hypothetical protein